MSAPWYASGTFWTAFGAVAVIIVGVATVLVTYLMGTQRRRLTYSMPIAIPLITSGSDDVRSKIEIRYRSRPDTDSESIADPYVARIRLASKGRKDIRSEDFDQGRPIRFDIGTRIVELIQTKSEPTSSAVPEIGVEASRLLVKAGLIHGNQTLEFAVLTDGQPAELTCENYLIDVTVRDTKEEQRASRRTKLISLAAVSVVLICIGYIGISQAVRSINRCNGLPVPVDQPEAHVTSAQAIVISWTVPRCDTSFASKYSIRPYDFSKSAYDSTQYAPATDAPAFVYPKPYPGLNKGDNYSFCIDAITSSAVSGERCTNNMTVPK